MQVLGHLVKLTACRSSLPIPWWHRAPLGLLDGTHVHVGLVETGRELGDIVVSVLDLKNAANTLIVRACAPDKPGVIAEALAVTGELNIPLAETLTLENNNQHEVTFVCETYTGKPVHPKLGQIETALREQGFRDVVVEYLRRDPYAIKKHEQKLVDAGWLNGLAYRKWIEEHYPRAVGDHDLDLVVISADTERRTIRYTFPRRGTKTFLVEHADRPGAMKAIFGALAKKGDLNVLSALLRRGGQSKGRAELVAVCEPEDADRAPEIVADARRRVEAIGPNYSPSVRVSDGRRDFRLIYPSYPDSATRPIILDRTLLGDDEAAWLIPTLSRLVEQHDFVAWETEGSAVTGQFGCILMLGTPGSGPGFEAAYRVGRLLAGRKRVFVFSLGSMSDALEGWMSGSGVPACTIDPGAAPDGVLPEDLVVRVSEWLSGMRGGTRP